MNKRALLLSAAVFMSCTNFSLGENAHKTVAVLEDYRYPNHMHNVVDIIGKKDTQIYLTNVSDDKKYIKALRKVSYGPERVVNLSIQSCQYNIKERALIEQMISDGKIVVVASGNSDRKKINCPTIYPAGYKLKGLIVAGYTLGRQENVDIFENGKHCTKKTGCMSGSSQATARVSRIALDHLKKGIHPSVIIDIFDKK